MEEIECVYRWMQAMQIDAMRVFNGVLALNRWQMRLLLIAGYDGGSALY